jgi:hypothetical protein
MYNTWANPTNPTNTSLDKLIKEYDKITKAIENIHEKINTYKKTIEEKIENAIDDHEINMFVKEFKSFSESVKNDQHINNKYKLLKQKQTELHNQIILYETKSNNKVPYVNTGIPLFILANDGDSKFLSDLRTVPQSKGFSHTPNLLHHVELTSQPKNLKENETNPNIINNINEPLTKLKLKYANSFCINKTQKYNSQNYNSDEFTNYDTNYLKINELSYLTKNLLQKIQIKNEEHSNIKL